MYTEENERGKFPLRDILLKGIVVIIFLILIIFIITKVTTSETIKTKTSNYDKVFSENLNKMEEVAIIYFTKEKLPTELGKFSELTLRDMINSNLLEAFTDADGKACDVNKSYIRLTKNENDYTLKVNLKCNQKEDYSLTKVGEYDYCKHYICKKDSSKETTSTSEENEEQEVVEEVEITESVNENITSTNKNSQKTTSVSEKPISNNNSKTTMYEYKQIIEPILSSWSSWSNWSLNKDKYTAIKCNNSDINCLKEIQLYSRIEKIGVANGKPVYATVHYYSYRTRTLIRAGSIDIKWSTYNDITLLNQGYGYTGNYK